jgi:hypothetical protein
VVRTALRCADLGDVAGSDDAERDGATAEARLPRVAGQSESRPRCPSRNQSRARARSDHGFESSGRHCRITPIAAATPWLLLEHETGSATISALTRWRARRAASRSSPSAVSRGAPGLPRLRIACSPISWILASASPTWTPPFGRKGKHAVTGEQPDSDERSVAIGIVGSDGSRSTKAIVRATHAFRVEQDAGGRRRDARPTRNAG